MTVRTGLKKNDLVGIAGPSAAEYPGEWRVEKVNRTTADLQGMSTGYWVRMPLSYISDTFIPPRPGTRQPYPQGAIVRWEGHGKELFVVIDDNVATGRAEIATLGGSRYRFKTSSRSIHRVDYCDILVVEVEGA